MVAFFWILDIVMWLVTGILYANIGDTMTVSLLAAVAIGILSGLLGVDLD